MLLNSSENGSKAQIEDWIFVRASIEFLSQNVILAFNDILAIKLSKLTYFYWLLHLSNVQK